MLVALRAGAFVKDYRIKSKRGRREDEREVQNGSFWNV